ncbi:TetR/AcrR family transcriptional regulator [Actinomadura sp. CNU-125]|uniref:TetR/AcrR family transcriptional regulator n=1 Tax=Actinomadura sp. CNU-125 TaxID=1904961 RepID=UPI0021CCFCE9|nr:TetR/AcrR family transcriptional regulator [Actinomadura sp. CNU-125]
MTAEVSQKLRSDAGDNRIRILAAARVAFAREGFDVPVREIARRAQVSAATVYRRFPTKEALFVEAFSEQLAMCSEIVEEGLAEDDPWRGFALVIEKVMEAHALDRGFRAFVAQLPPTAEFTADRARALRGLLELVRRAKKAGRLRADFVPEDIVLAMMANDGIRAESPRMRAAASRRLRGPDDPVVPGGPRPGAAPARRPAAPRSARAVTRDGPEGDRQRSTESAGSAARRRRSAKLSCSSGPQG